MARILVVEDDVIHREMVSRYLELAGYQVIAAGDGKQAVALSRSESPDLILMDLSLPRMDGWEATRRLKADAATARIPVIVLSAHAMNGDEDRARAAGCDDFLTKPIDETVLFQTIARHLGN